jgi:hypothetical protein
MTSQEIFVFYLADDASFRSRVARFFLVQNTKTVKNIPNYQELYQMSIKNNKRP